MIYDVSHRTTFLYEEPVSISHHVLHLEPRSSPRQTSLRSAVIVDPAPSVRSAGRDYFGNPTIHLTIQDPHERLVVHATSRIEKQAGRPVDFDRSQSWEEVRRRLESSTDAATLDACPFAFASPYVATDGEVLEFALPSFPSGRPILAAAADLTARLHREFEYRGGVTDVSTPVDQVLRSKKGVCQDFAHLQIACLRRLGLPARYISGYLMTRPPAGQEKLVGADASHAWVSVWCPDVGWVDFDPTNNLLPADEHVTLAWGRDYGDVSPINGFMVGGGSHKVSVAVDVALAAEPRGSRMEGGDREP